MGKILWLASSCTAIPKKQGNPIEELHQVLQQNNWEVEK
jgi:hypothetical protein